MVVTREEVPKCGGPSLGSCCRPEQHAPSASSSTCTVSCNAHENNRQALPADEALETDPVRKARKNNVEFFRRGLQGMYLDSSPITFQ